ncbi:MAG TPA: 3-isopropylmalate dehydrogenase [Vicinamibacterales bacterium]
MRLVVLPGDGVGPEVVACGLEVLRAAERRFGFTCDIATYPIGGAALRLGKPALPRETLDAALGSDAVLLGAVGDPAFDHLPRAERLETGLLELRKSLQVYANLRPARAWDALGQVVPFKPERISGTDVLIVRELLGGLYFGEPRGLAADGSYGLNTLRYTPVEVERVTRVAFELARKRRRKVTSVDKANVLESSQLWRATVSRVAAEYPDVTLEHQYVDACAMNLALDPRRFDVIVTENLFGDILSDEAGAFAGSLGMLPSASLGAGPGLYEPVHGSAPTLAGKDAANPIGTIASVALLLRHSAGREEAAAAIEAAIAAALDDGCRTPDIAAPGETVLTCSAMGRAIAERV